MPIHKCEKCNKEFNKKSGYDSHTMRINPCIKSIIINECSYCNKIFSLKHNLTAHLKICKEKPIEDDNTQLQIKELKKLFDEQQKQNEELNKKVEELSNTIKILLSSGNITKIVTI